MQEYQFVDPAFRSSDCWLFWVRGRVNEVRVWKRPYCPQTRQECHPREYVFTL